MRGQMAGKLKNVRGETLAEALTAILVTALSTALFLGMMSAASKIGREGDRADAWFYKSMSLLENFQTEAAPDTEAQEQIQTGAGTVKVEAEDGSVSQAFEVDIYYGNDMASYRLREGGTP